MEVVDVVELEMEVETVVLVDAIVEVLVPL